MSGEAYYQRAWDKIVGVVSALAQWGGSPMAVCQRTFIDRNYKSHAWLKAYVGCGEGWGRWDSINKMMLSSLRNSSSDLIARSCHWVGPSIKDESFSQHPRVGVKTWILTSWAYWGFTSTHIGCIYHLLAPSLILLPRTHLHPHAPWKSPWWGAAHAIHNAYSTNNLDRWKTFDLASLCGCRQSSVLCNGTKPSFLGLGEYSNTASLYL